MNILVIGDGAREHAIALKLRQSPLVERLFVAPGNAGTAKLATNLPIASTEIDALAGAVQDYKVDLTAVGPELPLAMGIVDRLQAEGRAIVGPTQRAARIETSKLFAKHLMLEHGIPTAQARAFSIYQEAKTFVADAPLPLVVKADGLAAGKGVMVCHQREEALQAVHDCMEDQLFGSAGEHILIEECLTGEEVSVFAFTDGLHLSSLVAACDYKRALDGDEGPNTGGMGSYSPPPFWSPELSRQVLEQIMRPTVQALAACGSPYRGVLYAGLMLTQEGPKVLEFNCRLGDPETQVILPRLNSDLAEVFMAVANGTVGRASIEWSPEPCVGVVATSGGYPSKYQTGYRIEGLEELEPDVLVFHAGTRIEERAGREVVLTDGGRVLTVVARASSVVEARRKVYSNLRQIHFPDIQYRKDIAQEIGTQMQRRSDATDTAPR